MARTPSIDPKRKEPARKVVLVRMTDAQHARLQKQAKRQGKSVPALLRDLAGVA
jgi:hypothetical protein